MLRISLEAGANQWSAGAAAHCGRCHDVLPGGKPLALATLNISRQDRPFCLLAPFPCNLFSHAHLVHAEALGLGRCHKAHLPAPCGRYNACACVSFAHRAWQHAQQPCTGGNADSTGIHTAASIDEHANPATAPATAVPASAASVCGSSSSVRSCGGSSAEAGSAGVVEGQQVVVDAVLATMDCAAHVVQALGERLGW